MRSKIIEQVREVLKIEAEAVLGLLDRVGPEFERAVKIILKSRGRVILTGMGKSGLVARKISATLNSTGTPSLFLHPAEAIHGDLGMVARDDVIVAISHSGNTAEINTILPMLRKMGAKIISFTGALDSSLAKESDVVIDVGVEREACPMGLAPTASTTAALAMGDALAVALLEGRGFTSNDFALSHPAGRLGKRLLLHVGDIMHRDETIPRVAQSASLSEALVEMTRKGLGMTTVIDTAGRLLGVFTDGDLRRVLDHGEVNVHQVGIAEHMTHNCKTIQADRLAAEALQMMDSYRINALPVVDEEHRLVGAINMHDLLRAGVV